MYSNESLETVQIHAYAGLRVNGQPVYGPVTLQIRGDQIEVQTLHRGPLKFPEVHIASRAGRWIDIDHEERPTRRTVGWLLVTPRKDHLQIVNIVPLETYVLGIVEPELGSLHFNPESLKAQVIASRSYVLASRGRHRREGFDFCDRPHCQMFCGTSSIRPDYKLAMETSRGLYLSYHGRPIPAFYHDNCGGKTASVHDIWGTPSVPYLRSVSDGDDESICRLAPMARWHFEASRQELRDCFNEAGWLTGEDALDTLRVIRINGSSRAHQVLVESSQPHWVPAREFRRTINNYFGHEVLKSTYFSIQKSDDGFVFNGRGWGHGVGLCQWGAIEMARKGKTAREILAHYYPGTTLDRLPEPEYAVTDYAHDSPVN